MDSAVIRICKELGVIKESQVNFHCTLRIWVLRIFRNAPKVWKSHIQFSTLINKLSKIQKYPFHGRLKIIIKTIYVLRRNELEDEK